MASTKDVITDFYTREASAVHDVMDELGVPRMAPEGGALSMSQRAKLLLDAMLQLNVSLRLWREHVEGQC